MAKLPILIAPDPRLKQSAKPVQAVTPEIVQLMDDMLETMYAAPGIGLAAPQVGELVRVIVVDPAGEDDTPQPLKLVNPEVIWSSEQEKEYDEGCLSVPDFYEHVTRPDLIKVRYLDETGTQLELEADGLLSVVIQHEIDHLDGKLFVDYISSLKRNMILRKLKKTKKAAEPAPV